MNKIIRNENKIFLLIVKLGPIILAEVITEFPERTLSQLEGNRRIYYQTNKFITLSIPEEEIEKLAVDELNKIVYNSYLFDDLIMKYIGRIFLTAYQVENKTNFEKAIIEEFQKFSKIYEKENEKEN